MRLSNALLGLAVLAGGCSQSPDRLPAGNFDSGPTAGTGLAESSSGDLSDESGDDATSDILDVSSFDVGTPDEPLAECVSVTQSASSDDRPADIILIGDPAADQTLLQAAVNNLSPQLESEGVADTRVILIAGAPPPSSAGYPCDEWVCWEEGQVSSFFRYIEADVGSQTILTDLLSLSAEWTPFMREESVKHVWIQNSHGRDESTTIEAFSAMFAAMGGSYSNFTVHTLLTGTPQSSDLITLAESTDGVTYHPNSGGEVYLPFVEGVSEQLITTPLSCEYIIPPAPDGQIFARDRVNVDYSDADGLQTVGYVEGPEACADVSHGWYYDDAVAPTEILMCPATCGLFRASEFGSIDIRFGCQTTPAG